MISKFGRLPRNVKGTRQHLYQSMQLQKGENSNDKLDTSVYLKWHSKRRQDYDVR